MGEDYRNWPIKRWYQMLEEIYGERNKDRTHEQLWLHVVEELGSLARDMRKGWILPRFYDGRSQGALVNVADVFAWHAAFTSRFGNLEDFLEHKFPGVCPYCLAEVNCQCISLEKKPALDEEKLSKQRSDFALKNPKTVYGWQQILTRIYGKINRTQSISDLAWHLTEEIGEVVKAYRENDLENLHDELADVFAHLVAVTTKCGDIIGKEFRLDDIIWERYSDKCPFCNSKPCLPDCEKSKNLNNGR